MNALIIAALLAANSPNALNGIAQAQAHLDQAIKAQDGKTVTIPFATPPSAPACVKVNVYADAACMESLGLAPDVTVTVIDGKESKKGGYVRIEVCGEGEQSLPSCAIPVDPTQEPVPWSNGKAMLVAKRDTSDDSPCACSTGTDCDMQIVDDKGTASWVTAPKGLTIAGAKWRGAGCRRKTCVELSGKDSMPDACALPPVAPLPFIYTPPAPQPDRYTVTNEDGTITEYVLSPCPPGGAGACYVANGPGFPKEEP